MACEKCKEIPYSYRDKPFIPPDGDHNKKLHTCKCGTNWLQFNGYYHLWTQVPDEAYALLQKGYDVAIHGLDRVEIVLPSSCD